MNSESGNVFFADGILARTFKSAAERLSDACLVIEQKNFFEDLHENCLLFRASPMPVDFSGKIGFFTPPIFTERLQSALLTLWCTGRVSGTFRTRWLKGNSKPY